MKGKRVLIVDDSTFMRQMLLQALVSLGAECVQAGDGGEGLALLRRQHCFDLLLLDLNMPVMSGLECLRHLQQERLARNMKVMMVTSECDVRSIEQALEFGADEFLMKPFTQQSLREKLLLLGFDPHATWPVVGA